jgi:ATP adenylyltransferase
MLRQGAVIPLEGVQSTSPEVSVQGLQRFARVAFSASLLATTYRVMVSSSETQFEPGTLWDQVQRQTRHGLACGALQPIETRYEYLEQAGIRFLVRILANLARKEKAATAQKLQPQAGQSFNPFLPYEADLFVTHISPTHLCLLNKYNVVDHHLLIVTRHYEDQDSWLTREDLHALVACMREIDGLAFYNGGRLAGASQPHKHLQLVPFPLCPDGQVLPITPIIQPTLQSLPMGQCGQCDRLPFKHAILPLSPDWLENTAAATYLIETYQQVLKSLNVNFRVSPKQFPYNLLITRQWMMVVLRCQEHYQSIPVNSLGFTGSLLVKNARQLELLKSIGPMTLLQQVACA